MNETLSPPRCPICRIPMVLRKAGRGPNAGKDFWGCSSYPRCKGTQNLSDSHQRDMASAIIANQKKEKVPPPIPEVRTELSEKQKEQLHKLRDRLLNLSSRNRSVKLNRLDAKWTFDLSSLNALNEKRVNELIEFCLKSSGEISILPKAKNENDADVLKSLFTKLVHLDRSVKEIEREKGLHDLYIGFPFLSGIPKGSGTVIQAPIFLIPVKLEKKTPLRGQVNWHLSVTKDNPPVFNKTLFLTLSKVCNLKVNQNLFDEEIPDELYGEQTLIQKVHEILNEYGIICHIHDDANDSVFDPLNSFKTDQVNDLFEDGKLVICQNAILGHFPQSNSSVQKDYDEFLKMSQEELGDVISFLEEVDSTSSDAEVANVTRDVLFGESNTENLETIDRRKESDNFFLLASDSSQDRILLELEKTTTKGIVIWGPPGTGKSQTIVNIVGDCLSQNKSVLIVSQKRAALDVVFDRLGSREMDNLLGLVHDSKEDRKVLYTKLVQELSNIKAAPQRKKVSDPSPEIENVTKTLKDVTSAYIDDAFGISLGELYRIASNASDLKLKLDSVWKSKNLQEIEAISQQLNSMQGHGSVLSGTKYDEHRKPLFSSSGNFEELKALVVEVFEGETYYEAKHIHSKVSSRPSRTTSRLSDYHEVLEDHAKYTSVLKFLSMNWWRLRSRLKNHIEFAATFLEKFSQNTKDQLSLVVTQEKAIHIAMEVRTAQFADIDLRQFVEYVATEFYRLKGFDHDFNLLTEDVRKIVVDLDKLYASGCVAPGVRWGDYFKSSVFQMWILELEKKHPVVAQVRSGRAEELRKRLRELLDLKVEYSVQELKSKYRLGPASSKAADEILRDVSKQRSVPSIRKLNEKFMDRPEFRQLLPVWLSSPESVSDMFPLKKGLFDVVIFDEASQCTVENGLPAIFRGKQVVVAGDEKQLPPSKFFESSISSDDDEESEEAFATVEPSLLTLSKKNLRFQSHMLEWHYRSKKQELISFSNQQFYDGRMKVAPNVIPFKKGNKPAIDWVAVSGYWENRCNEIEAEAVLKRIRHYLSLDNPPTVGVITFNLQQKTIIQDKIDDLETEDTEFAALLERDKKRTSENGKELDIRLFVKNIENVQGDERDIIIFSIGYAPTAPGGRVYQRFGPLGTSGGENRLNVAVTRAIRKIDIVCSIDPERDLDTSMSKNVGPKIFKQYLTFAKAVAEENYDKADKVLQDINPNLKSQGTGKTLHFDSPFEEEVYEELTKLGLEVHTQVGQSGFRIDLAVVHPDNPDRYLLGIECDGAMFHSGVSIRERDVFRQRFLEGRGWQIHRIWSSNWWANKEAELKKITLLVSRLKAG